VALAETSRQGRGYGRMMVCFLGTENESRRHANKVPSLAVLDLAEIRAYISTNNPDAARRG